jgi:hypothetical protein
MVSRGVVGGVGQPVGLLGGQDLADEAPLTGQPSMPLRAAPYRWENSGGTARDVVCFFAVEAAGQPDAGNRFPEGPFTVASTERQKVPNACGPWHRR